MFGEESSRVRRSGVVLAVTFICVLLAGAGVSAQSSGTVEAENVREYDVSPPASAPESVVYDDGTNAFYGSSADGAIFAETLGDPDPTGAETFLAAGMDGDGTVDGRTAAAGVNVADGRLYVAGAASGDLYVYDIATRDLLARFQTGAGGFINDVAITKNGDAYYTDSFRPIIFRITQEQIDAAEANQGQPDEIPLAPEVSYSPVTPPAEPNDTFNANGIEATPEGFLIFSDLNDSKLYRMNPAENPEDRTIREITVNGPIDNPDGLELSGNTLYTADNLNELIIEMSISDDYLSATVESNTTSEAFHTPTGVSLTPDGSLLVPNPEFFDMTDADSNFFVVRIKAPGLDDDGDDGDGNQPGACTISGNDRDNVLRGTSGRDVICGFGGKDVIRGLGGNDVLRGGAGNDALYGGGGNDQLVGSSGKDALYGNAGGDSLDTRDGVNRNDSADGGSGDDSCRTDAQDSRTSC